MTLAGPLGDMLEFVGEGGGEQTVPGVRSQGRKDQLGSDIPIVKVEETRYYKC